MNASPRLSRDFVQPLVDGWSVPARRLHAVVVEERVDVMAACELGAFDSDDTELRRRRRTELAPGPRRVGWIVCRLWVGGWRARFSEESGRNVLGPGGLARRATGVRLHRVVIGDRQDREPSRAECPHDLRHVVATVALNGVDVKVGAVMRDRFPSNALVWIRQRCLLSQSAGGAGARERRCKREQAERAADARTHPHRSSSWMSMRRNSTALVSLWMPR